MILDVDTVVMQGAIDKLAGYLDRDQNCGLVAPKLIAMNWDLQFTCRKYPTIVSKFFRAFNIKFGRAEKILKEEEMRDWDHNSIREVDYVIGACQMIRKSIIEKIGLIDENIFYGPEDVDFCLRIRRARYKVIYNPESVIIHMERRVARGAFFSKLALENFKGTVYYFWKHKYLFSRESIYRSIDGRNSLI